MKWKVPMPKVLPEEGKSLVRVGIKSSTVRFELESSDKGVSNARAALIMLALTANDEMFDRIDKAVLAIGDQS